MPRDVAGTKKAAKKGVSWASYTSPNGLLSKTLDLQLTPLQAVLQFFEYDKGGDVGQYYLEGLRKILDLLPECDWSECHPDGWVALDSIGHKKSLIVSFDMLVKHHLEPLLGPIDDTSEFLRQLMQMSGKEKDDLVAAAAMARDNPLAGHGGSREGAGRPLSDDEKSDLAAAVVEVARKEPLSHHGGARAEINQGYVVTLINRGHSQSYLLRRIARDNPDMLDEIGPGRKYRSARQAAIAAGIIDDIPTVHLRSPEQAAAKVIEKAGREWAAALAARLTELLTEEAP